MEIIDKVTGGIAIVGALFVMFLVVSVLITQIEVEDACKDAGYDVVKDGQC